MSPVVVSERRDLGMGCFETMLGYRGTIPLIHHHFSRLQRSLDLLNWVRPEALTAQSVCDWYLSQNPHTGLQHSKIRLHVYRSNDEIQWTLTHEAIEHPTPPVTLKTVRVANEHNSIHEQLCKLADRAVYDQALARATTSAAHDALLVTNDGLISESCIAGVLVLKKGRFFTPGVQSGGLRGVGLEFLKPLMISNLSLIKDRSFDLDFVKQADSVWLVNALRGPYQVQQLDGESLRFDHEMHQQVYRLFWNRIDELSFEAKQ